nr:helix-turn-helix transcriptional regulator [uncultured Tyzzerella sp.]
MHKKNYNYIFSKNLNYILLKTGKKQIDLSRDLKIPKATISSWCCGTRLPKIDKLSHIATYLDIDNPIILLDENFKTLLKNK